LLLLATAATLAAQPFVFYRGILNATSFAPQGLPNGSIARGSIFALFGRGLGPPEGDGELQFPLSTTLGGVSVEVCQGAICLPAIPLYASDGQINAIMPSNAPLGPVSLRVTYNGAAGNFSPAEVVASSFGAIAVNGGGFGPGIIQNFIAADNLPLNSAVDAARPGQTVILWGTGLGAGLNADNERPQAGDLPVAVDIWAGGKAVTVKRYSGRTPCCAGVDQISFDVPADAPTGCYVPVVLRAGGVVSNSVTMAITSDGGACSDPANPLDAARPGGRVGLVLLSRVYGEAELPMDLHLDFTSDLAGGVFQDEGAGPWHFNRLYSLPPPGACTTFSAKGGSLKTDMMAGLIASGTRLSAGEQLTLAGPSGDAVVRPLPAALNFYGTLAGTTLDVEGLMSLFFGGASSRVSSAGGPDVGAFEVEMAPVPRLDWTNRDELGAVLRGVAVDVTWTGGAADSLVAVMGIGRNPPSQSAAGFLCVERAAAGRVSVPSWATASVPQGGSADEPAGLMTLIALPAEATRFTAAGLDLGFGVFSSAEAIDVDFQ
jgi:uncharacterized protein (TIGR03437 family)